MSKACHAGQEAVSLSRPVQRRDAAQREDLWLSVGPCLALAVIELIRHISPRVESSGEMVMRINWKILLQITIAAAVGLGVIYLQRQRGGPGDGMVPGLLGFLIAWLVIPAISNDIVRLRHPPSFIKELERRAAAWREHPPSPQQRLEVSSQSKRSRRRRLKHGKELQMS
jgi:hypothetical protein